MPWYHRAVATPHEAAPRAAHRTAALATALSLAVSGLTLVQPSVAEAAGRTTASAGSASIGSTNYAVPSGARFVSPSGSNAASGSASSPWRSLAHAIAKAGSGSTIVLRRGTYHESVTVPSGKRLTIQAYPGEAVWLDGSKRLSSWSSDGGDWRHGGWTARFDYSASYTSGAALSGDAFFRFIDPAYPLASRPEQLFVNGAAQRQVGSRSAVVPGTFYVDKANSRLYMGTSPVGKEVRASTLKTALSVQGSGSVVRGIGVRRYATSLPLMGTLRVLASNVTLENVTVADNATQGIFINKSGVRLTRITSQRNGSMGVQAVYADGLKVERAKVIDNNTERFKKAPAAGGLKITRSRVLSFRNSVFANNHGTGLWMDESVYDAKVIGNDMTGNASHGSSFEISSNVVYANNLVAKNAGQGLKINNATNVQVWNNTVVGNGGRPIWLVQDSRLAKNTSTFGHDPRRPLPDPTVTWVLKNLSVHNNVFSGTGSSNKTLLQLQDDALDRSAGSIGIVTNGNAYRRPSTSSPSYATIWARGGSNPYVFTSIAKMRSTTGQESRGREWNGTSIVDASYRPTSALRDVTSAMATPLSSTIASLTGKTAGSRHVGAWMG
jgi:hypothetical protein